jgi:ketosteroid isomerase-like protein
MRLRSLVALVLLPTLTSPLVAQDQKTTLLATDRAAAQLSSDSGFAAALLGNMHPDAVLLWPGAPVAAGGEDLRKLLGALPGRDSMRLVWQPLGLELAQDSTLGLTWGVAVSTSRSANALPRIGRYTTVWRRDDGRWTIAAQLVNGVAPVSAAALPKELQLIREPAKPTGAAVPFVAADLAFARLAGQRGAAPAFRRWAAPQAFTLGGAGLMTRGPEAIGTAVAGPANWRWHPVISGASQIGDMGWTVGEAVIAPKGAEPEFGKYLTVWIRRPGGAPRFLTDGGNARPAVGAATKPGPQ